jgi:acyl-CoA thioesterase
MASRKIKHSGSPTFNLDGKIIPVRTIDAARSLWITYRDDNGLGQSDVARGTGNFYDEEGTLVAYVSYNGRMWTGTPAELKTRNASQEIK